MLHPSGTGEAVTKTDLSAIGDVGQAANFCQRATGPEREALGYRCTARLLAARLVDLCPTTMGG